MRTLTVSLSLFLALGLVSARQQVVGTIEKNPGKPHIAVTDFRATGTIAPTLMATFNSTVQSDLQSSPLINFIPKTLYPLRIPQVPNDLAAGEASANARPAPTPGFRLADWYAAPTTANYLGIGYGAEDRGLFVVFGYFYTTAPNITDLQQAQVFGKIYTASLDQSGALDAAHRYAADILSQFGGQSLVGSRIVFVSDRSGSNEIWVSDAEGGHARRITSFRGQPVGTPRWSPDGRDIVFDAARSGRSVICTVSAYSEGTDGGDAKLFQEDRWDNMMPSWSGDGRFIYFVSRRDNNLLLLFKKQLNDGAVTQLAHRSGGEGLEAPGKNTVFFSDGKNGIWQVSTAGGDEIPVPGLEHVRHRRYFAATRRGLYFLQQDSPPWFIGLYDYASHAISRIAEIQKQPLFNTPSLAVSPDGRWIIYGQLDDGGSDILMVEDFQ